MAEIIEQNQLWVISDEIHCDLLRRNQKHIPPGRVMPEYQRLITCMAPSKTFNLAGMMISNIMIRDEKLREIWLEELRIYPDENLPLFFAYKAGVLLESGNMFVQNSDGFVRFNLATDPVYVYAAYCH